MNDAKKIVVMVGSSLFITPDSFVVQAGADFLLHGTHHGDVCGVRGSWTLKSPGSWRQADLAATHPW
jgi:hypothetical protein